jgi:DNA polymerase-4
MERVILHMDMDAFYASVEQMDDPSLKGKPVMVGGTSDRGVVSAASYEARAFGVHSAMPIFQARKQCPHGIYLPVRMKRYKEISGRVMEVLKGMTPLVEQISIDEAYMDFSGTERIWGTPVEIGGMVKAEIRKATSLTCSIGIAPNKFLAKIASDMEKPDGLTIIPTDEIPRVVASLPIGKVPGVGQRTAERLKRLGVLNLGDVRNVPEALLLKKVGSFARRLMAYASGMDPSPVRPHHDVKSISSENTLPANTEDREVLKRYLRAQSEIVGRRMRRASVRGTTVTLKLKDADFRQTTRSTTLDHPIQSSNEIYRQVLKLLTGTQAVGAYRLVGVGVSNLVPQASTSRQLSLFKRDPGKDQAWEEVERAMDRIRERFGEDAIKRGG